MRVRKESNMTTNLPPSRPAWEECKDALEKSGFKENVHDLLHFREHSQWTAWAKLAEMEDSPEVDAYLRTLAPDGMVYIPAGPFWMGSADDVPHAEPYEKPRHEVYLPGYYIDRCPVTNAQYRAFIEAGGYRELKYWTQAGRIWKGKSSEPWYWYEKNFNQDQQPVVGVSWYEAAAYAKWAGKALPSEAQWEKAASWDPVAKRQRSYPWGDGWDPDRCSTHWRAGERTTPVGQYSPAGDSAYGVADMVGNVWEWCSTLWYDEQGEPYRYPYTANDGRENLEQTENEYRCRRGGSWANTDRGQSMRCSYRRLVLIIKGW